MRFGQALLAGGDGLVSPGLVARMTTDRLTTEQRQDPMAAPFLDGGGWGWGVGVHPSGRYGWMGGFGTGWWNDPGTGRVHVLLTQRTLYPEPAALVLRWLDQLDPVG